MSWQAVARKDFRDAIRSRMFWALAIVFALFAVGVGAIYGYFDVFGGQGTERQGFALAQFVSSPVALFVILTAVIICHKSIVGERDSGSVKILLSLPHTRLDVVIGKIVGRTGVLAVPALASLVLGIAVGGAMIGSAPLVHTVVFMLSTGLLILTYVSLAVGLSAFVNSSSLATALAVGYFIVFELLWELVGTILLFTLDLSQNSGLYYLFLHIPPSNASNAVTDILVSGLTDVPSGVVAPVSEIGSYAESTAFYVTPWLGAIILVFWMIVPAALGYWRFNNADL